MCFLMRLNGFSILLPFLFLHTLFISLGPFLQDKFFPFLFFPWIYLVFLMLINLTFPIFFQDSELGTTKIIIRRQKLASSCKGVNYFYLGPPFTVVQLLCGRKFSRQREQRRFEIHTRPCSTCQILEQDSPWLRKVAHVFSSKGTFCWPSCAPRGVSLLPSEDPLSK